MMKRIKLFTVCCIFAMNLYAQRATDEQPYGLQDSFREQTQNTIILTTPDMVRIEMEDIENDQYSSPLRYAYPVLVNYTTDNSGVWQQLDDGSKIWRLKVSLPDALSTNTYYDKFWLPKGSKFFIYSENTRQSIGAITSELIESSRENPIKFATALIFGEDVVYEYYQPDSVKELPVIFISRIDYGYRYVNDLRSNESKNFGDADACNININCNQGQNWQAEKEAIARVSVVSPNGSFWCSCALINNTNNDNTPYVLTANHCLEGLDAIDNANASQWVFFWHYEHPGCVNSTIQPPLRTSTGATVVANNSASDFALLRINDIQHPALVNGVTPYYLGWDRSGNSVANGIGIHHPRGDVKKISLTNSVSNQSSKITIGGQSCAANTHWKVVWNEGTTQGGSSGSPLFNNNGRIIGQLHGGSASCSNLSAADYYGKFNVSWTGDNSTNNRRRLRDWLDPSNTTTTLNGKNCNLTLNNRSYSSGTHILAGCTVEISNTTIEPNTTVRIHGQQSVVLKPSFHAKAGSNVIITAGGSTNRSTKMGNDNEDTTSMLKSLELAVKTTGITSMTETINMDFIVYPNPNDGNFTVKITGEIQPYTVEIFNSLGGLLGYVNCNDGTVNINRTDLNAGIYYIKITMNEKIVVKKIIVQ